MGMGFAPTWLRQVSPLLPKSTLTTAFHVRLEWNAIEGRSIYKRQKLLWRLYVISYLRILQIWLLAVIESKHF